MGRLTPEMIENALQYLNPVGQYELCLRGKPIEITCIVLQMKTHGLHRNLDMKIPTIENLGATLNQFDTIDFTSNEIRKLDGFPNLPKIKTLYLANNHIS